MYKVLVFAGTTEGYEICRFLADHRVQTKGFVATEYGSKSLQKMISYCSDRKTGCSSHGGDLFTGETGNGAGCYSSLCC